MSQSLSILGASARSAAQSARRAGLIPSGADLFADQDLHGECATVVRVSDYPRGLVDAAARLPIGPWMYTGGLENHPEVVDQLSAQRTLLGNPGAVLRRVRDPWQLSSVLTSHGLLSPTVHRDTTRLPNERWIRKPLQSCGGQRVSTVGQDDGESADADFFYQRLVSGVPHSAVYLAGRQSACLVGLTRQLVGTAWTGARHFQYAGSVGPVIPAEHCRTQLVHLGNVVAAAFQLRGLFGVDLILADGVWVLEVNPRYTASIEILEMGFDWSAVRDHLRACHGESPQPPDSGPVRHCGKAIVYARREVVISPAFVRFAREANAGTPFPAVADIPHVGQRLRCHQPVATALAVDEKRWRGGRPVATTRRSHTRSAGLLSANCKCQLLRAGKRRPARDPPTVRSPRPDSLGARIPGKRRA